jgi:hypothetical protein
MPMASAVETRQQGFSMNHSIYSADRTTHLKILVIALVIGIAGLASVDHPVQARMPAQPRPQVSLEPVSNRDYQFGRVDRSLVVVCGGLFNGIPAVIRNAAAKKKAPDQSVPRDDRTAELVAHA